MHTSAMLKENAEVGIWYFMIYHKITGLIRKLKLYPSLNAMLFKAFEGSSPAFVNTKYSQNWLKAWEASSPHWGLSFIPSMYTDAQIATTIVRESLSGTYKESVFYHHHPFLFFFYCWPNPDYYSFVNIVKISQMGDAQI